MSGTSLDGVDAALVQTDGQRILAFGESGYRPYTASERAALKAALGRWPGEDTGAALEVVQGAHAELLAGFPQAELVGFHGQTLAHEPRGRGTHQLGDGDALARALCRDVVWDFRSADVALGGEGAPLAPVIHCVLGQKQERPLAVLNIGGVANVTWLGRNADAATGRAIVLRFPMTFSSFVSLFSTPTGQLPRSHPPRKTILMSLVKEKTMSRASMAYPQTTTLLRVISSRFLPETPSKA